MNFRKGGNNVTDFEARFLKPQRQKSFQSFTEAFSNKSCGKEKMAYINDLNMNMLAKIKYK